MSNENLLPIIFETERFAKDAFGHKILSDPITAVVELIANAWDAGATEVYIDWPNSEQPRFRIKDNGQGMSNYDFQNHWLKLSYDRSKVQGLEIEIEYAENKIKRKVFGKHGKGRHAVFYFNKSYELETKTLNEENRYSVSLSEENNERPLTVKKIEEKHCIKNTGTIIDVDMANGIQKSAEDIIEEIGSRFLFDPFFKVFVNKIPVSFRNLDADKIDTIEVSEKGLEIMVIKVSQGDSTSKLHGIAWWVNNRLVGNFGWNIAFDKRRKEAKKFMFIIKAKNDDTDTLLQKFVMPDWSAFIPSKEFDELSANINEIILNYMNSSIISKAEETVHDLLSKNNCYLEKMGSVRRYKWKNTIREIIVKCPSLSETELLCISKILATMENSQSKYQLLNILSSMSSSNFDDLTQILNDWGIESIKIVLDELEFRMKLLSELEKKIRNENTDEVHELQPLFEQGLWMFGPEFESIEYTSNKGMATVVKELFKDSNSENLSSNRPDFVVLPDGNVGFYSTPSYDDNYEENGNANVIIVELKKPTVSISEKEKSQPYKYYKELKQKGYLAQTKKVTAYILGTKIAPGENGKDTKDEQRLIIIPMLYDTIISRAKSRLLKLYQKIQAKAPFLVEEQPTLKDLF